MKCPIPSFLFPADQKPYILHSRRLREHIHRLHLRKLIASVRAEELQIPGEGGRVAAHIDNALRGHGKHGLKTGAVTALPGRIDDNNVRVNAFFFIFLRQNLFCLAQIKFHIGDTV